MGGPALSLDATMEKIEGTRGVWRELLATVALILWSVQLLPQVYKNYKTKSTVGLSAWAFVFWALANILVASNSYMNQVVLPIFLQPQLFCTMSLVCLVQCYMYPNQGPRRAAWEGGLLLAALLIFCGSLEALWINFLISTPLHDDMWFTLLVGCVGPTITSLGFLPQYYDIICLKSTEGLSLMFIFLDLTGGVAALSSLALHDHFEFTVALMYIAVLSLEMGLLLLHVFYNRHKLLANFSKKPAMANSVYPALHDQPCHIVPIILDSDVILPPESSFSIGSAHPLIKPN